MKKYLRVISILIVCLILCGCELFGSSKQEVTFNYNCEGVDDYSCKIEDNKLNCMFTLPECSGKTFAGWYDAKTNGNPVNLDEDFTESKVIYAQWKEDQKLDPTTPIEPTTPETPIEPTTPDNPSEPEKPTPIIETIKYKVNFNTNGGVGGQTSAVEVKYKEMMPTISSTIPTRSNYTFMGWYDNSDYTKGKAYYNEKCEATKYYDREEDITLYAGWKEKPKPVEPTPEVVKYTISFNINSGTGTLPKDISIEYNATLPNINSSSPTRTGYEFIGWYDNGDYTKGNKYYSTDGKPVRTYNRKSDITLYAGWKIMTYKITYNLNDGSGGQTGSLSVHYNSALPQINKNIPTRSGFTFKGWYDNADYTKGKQYYNENNVAVRNYDKTSNLTLYAGWSKIIVVQKYQITFNLNGGTGTKPNNVSASLGSAMPSITTNVPTRSGYTFMGWYDNADYTKGKQYYTNKNASARNYDKTSGITLYAGWKINRLLIQYNGNGGTWNIDASSKYTVNKYGTVILNDGSGNIYTQKVNYGESLSQDGLINHNGKSFNWSKKDYGVHRGKDYIIKGTSVTLDQDIAYKSNVLAEYAGCDLRIQDCLIQVKVNYVKPIDIRNKKYYTRYSGVTGMKGYPQNFAIANFDKSNELLYISASDSPWIYSNNNNEKDIIALNTNIISKFEINNKKATYKESMYLKDSGHGQPFDYDTKRNIFILNDYKSTVTYGNQTYGSSTGLMGITFKHNNKGSTFNRLFSYNLNIKEPMPIIDVDNNILGTVSGRIVKIYKYNYDSLINGSMNFNNPIIQFTINRESPTVYSDGTSIVSQGFAIYDGFLYELSGSHAHDAYVEVFDLYGHSIYKVKLGNGYIISDSREAEGIKIYKNNIYFMSTYSSGSRKVDIGFYN